MLKSTSAHTDHTISVGMKPYILVQANELENASDATECWKECQISLGNFPKNTILLKTNFLHEARAARASIVGDEAASHTFNTCSCWLPHYHCGNCGYIGSSYPTTCCSVVGGCGPVWPGAHLQQYLSHTYCQQPQAQV